MIWQFLQIRSHVSRVNKSDQASLELTNQTKRLSSYQIRQSTSRVIKMPDTLWPLCPYRGREIQIIIFIEIWFYTWYKYQIFHFSRVIKSEKAPLEWSRCPTHSGPSAPIGRWGNTMFNFMEIWFDTFIKSDQASLEWSNQTKRLSSDQDARHTLVPLPL